MNRQRRRELGAWYTPAPLVDAVATALLDGWHVPAGREVRVLDPACGDGRFLLAVHDRLASTGCRVRVTGIDIDANALDAARSVLAGVDAELVLADALGEGAMPVDRFDLVVGNPPFLTPLASRNARVATSSPTGSPYADAATQFLAEAWRALVPGGRLGFVLPQSVLANRDAAASRRAVAGDGALRWFWWSPRPVFDASVRTCAIVAARGDAHGTVQRVVGPTFTPAGPAPAPGDAWAALLADLGGVPVVGAIEMHGTVADHAWTAAGFRDEFYGVAAAVSDDADGPPLVTSGLIDPGVCHWGQRDVRVARRRFAAPRVDLATLSPSVRRWADRQLVPKVLVASQTKVIEAVADPDGVLLPGVPVVTVAPHSGQAHDVWRLAAALTNPVTAATLARLAGGSGMSANTFRVAARAVARLPWPSGSLTHAADRLAAGDVVGCACEAMAAYGIDPASLTGYELMRWWESAGPRTAGAQGA